MSDNTIEEEDEEQKDNNVDQDGDGEGEEEKIEIEIEEEHGNLPLSVDLFRDGDEYHEHDEPSIDSFVKVLDSDSCNNSSNSESNINNESVIEDDVYDILMDPGELMIPNEY